MTEGPLLFAFVAGTVASANPCGFALLPAFFLSYAGSPVQGNEDATRRVVPALAAGGAMTAAFAIVFGAVGGGLAAGAGFLMPAMPWATIAVGVVLVALGVAVLAGRHVSVPLPGALARVGGDGYRGPFLFGVAYAVASLSCTVPVFLAYAAGMGTVLTALALGAALARGGVHRAVRRAARHVSRASGALLVLAGAYLIYYWTFFLLPGSARRRGGKAAINALNDLTERLQTWLGFGAGAWAGRVLLGLIAVVAGLTLWRRLRGRPARTRAGRDTGP